ncbi:hypothetical protein [Loigolactobacillus backii]|uniref:Uncharacterized protein n=1 Tax=Loigolactobacillus backii TaxID=375175 RepID=A0A192H2M2_9LACO|nr:hypothetical protein [Loigolactobacillus backii]ANK60363.1 hypothetical protein AYR52_08935 [Loigolactobacillus backii]ANK62196.1 hypothetical protein AYR53_05060 [Loigolactobacillus backii]ANK65242.1 hypothetical protein AYR54_08340 [Loigolactobacillus backii]ANK67801.1 hypothetical protein AYR55_08945 [Loigolactobacillus backii]ANK70789.1 hypothetical protein AYR56_11925 [Loigolactobacillus backii]
MLNFNQPQLRDLIAAPADIGQIRQTTMTLYQKQRQYVIDKQQWMQNDQALLELTASYTRVFADKIWEAFNNDKLISQAELLEHIWMNVASDTNQRLAINLNYASDDGQNNTILFSINEALTAKAYLTAQHLPTLQQIKENASEAYFMDEEQFPALMQMIKLLYAAKIQFQTPRETVLQPVNNLNFKVIFPADKSFSTRTIVTDNVHEPAKLSINIGNFDVRHFKVNDDEKNDVTDLGRSKISDSGLFTWEAETIPDLLNHELTLTISAVEVDALPCLEDLFVTSSSNNILMKTGSTIGTYKLELPNQKELELTINSQNETLSLHYPDPETQIYELNHLYPFFSKWLDLAIQAN